MQLQHKIIIHPASGEKVSLGRKAWCRKVCGEAGVDWHVGWDFQGGAPHDVYSFTKEENATMFLLRWMNVVGDV